MEILHVGTQQTVSYASSILIMRRVWNLHIKTKNDMKEHALTLFFYLSKVIIDVAIATVKKP